MLINGLHRAQKLSHSLLTTSLRRSVIAKQKKRSKSMASRPLRQVQFASSDNSKDSLQNGFVDDDDLPDKMDIDDFSIHDFTDHDLINIQPESCLQLHHLHSIVGASHLINKKKQSKPDRKLQRHRAEGIAKYWIHQDKERAKLKAVSQKKSSIKSRFAKVLDSARRAQSVLGSFVSNASRSLKTHRTLRNLARRTIKRNHIEKSDLRRRYGDNVFTETSLTSGTKSTMTVVRKSWKKLLKSRKSGSQAHIHPKYREACRTSSPRSFPAIDTSRNEIESEAPESESDPLLEYLEGLNCETSPLATTTASAPEPMREIESEAPESQRLMELERLESLNCETEASESERPMEVERVESLDCETLPLAATMNESHSSESVLQADIVEAPAPIFEGDHEMTGAPVYAISEPNSYSNSSMTALAYALLGEPCPPQPDKGPDNAPAATIPGLGMLSTGSHSDKIYSATTALSVSNVQPYYPTDGLKPFSSDSAYYYRDPALIKLSVVKQDDSATSSVRRLKDEADDEPQEPTDYEADVRKPESRSNDGSSWNVSNLIKKLAAWISSCAPEDGETPRDCKRWAPENPEGLPQKWSRLEPPESLIRLELIGHQNQDDEPDGDGKSGPTFKSKASENSGHQSGSASTSTPSSDDLAQNMGRLPLDTTTFQPDDGCESESASTSKSLSDDFVADIGNCAVNNMDFQSDDNCESEPSSESETSEDCEDQSTSTSISSSDDLARDMGNLAVNTTAYQPSKAPETFGVSDTKSSSEHLTAATKPSEAADDLPSIMKKLSVDTTACQQSKMPESVGVAGLKSSSSRPAPATKAPEAPSPAVSGSKNSETLASGSSSPIFDTTSFYQSKKPESCGAAGTSCSSTRPVSFTKSSAALPLAAPASNMSETLTSTFSARPQTSVFPASGSSLSNATPAYSFLPSSHTRNDSSRNSMGPSPRAAPSRNTRQVNRMQRRDTPCSQPRVVYAQPDLNEIRRQSLRSLVHKVPEEYLSLVHEMIDSVGGATAMVTASERSVSSIPDLAYDGPGAKVTPFSCPKRTPSLLQEEKIRQCYRGISKLRPLVWGCLIKMLLQSGCTPKDLLHNQHDEILQGEWVIDYYRIDKKARGLSEKSEVYFKPETLDMGNRQIFDRAYGRIKRGDLDIFGEVVGEWASKDDSNKAELLKYVSEAGWVKAESEYTRFIRWAEEFAPDPFKSTCDRHFRSFFPRLFCATFPERLREFREYY